MKSHLFLARFIVVALAIGGGAFPLAAQVGGPPLGVAVRITAQAYVYFEGEQGEGSLELSGEFLPSVPGGSDGTAVISASSPDFGTQISAVLGAPGSFIRIEPSKSYTVTIIGANVTDGNVTISAPAGYRVVMENEYRTRLTFGSNATFVFQLQPAFMAQPGIAGTISSIDARNIDFKISLGQGTFGKSLGEIAFVDTGMGSDWSGFVSPAGLFYEPTAGDVTVIRLGSLRQVVAKQVVVDIVAPDAQTGQPFEIRLYHPSQASGTWLRTFSGSPYLKYRITTFDSVGEKVLRIAKHISNTTATTITPDARIEYLHLRRKGAWPNQKWTKTEWSTSSDWNAGVSETYAESAISGTTRTETLAVRTPAAGTPNTAVINLTRTFTRPSDPVYGETIGETLQSETLGTSSGATVALQYHTNPNDIGSIGNVKSAALPGGNWVSYVYHNHWSAGRVAYRVRPFLNSPTNIPLTAAEFWSAWDIGELTIYQYSDDVYGAPTRLSHVETRIGGVTVARTVTNYLDGQPPYMGRWGGDAYSTLATRTEFVSSGQTLVTKERQIMTNGEAPLASLPVSITRPDGTRQSYVYQLGSWTGMSFGDFSQAYGWSSRVCVINGSSNPAAGPSCTTVGGSTGPIQIDPVYLIDGKSSMDVAIRNPLAQVVRVESYVWKNSAWHRVSYTNFTYDLASRVISRAESNGALHETSYLGGWLRNWERNETGVETTFSYDAAGRLAYSIKAASTGIPELKTSYTYDAAGHVLNESVGPAGSEIVSSRTYDDAGRLQSETAPGLGTTNHVYSYFTPTPANNYTGYSHTITRPSPDGGTTIETKYLDGRAYSLTGTAVVPEYYAYGRETDGTTWKRVDFGAAASTRFTKVWKDGMGHEVKIERPKFGGGAVIEENFYNFTANQSSTGHLYRSTKPSPIASSSLVTRFDYDALGNSFRSGLDIGDNGLATASADRITETDATLEISGSDYWSKKTTYGYPFGGNSGTAVVLGVERRRLNNFPTGRLEETRTTDANGNVTTVTKDVNRSTRVATITTTRAGISAPQITKIENGLATEVTGHDGLLTKTVYDALHRPWKKIDARNNNTVETVYIAGTTLVASVKEKANTSSPLTVAAFTYDSVGRKVSETNALGKVVYSAYNKRSQLLRQWGSATYPVAYAYNALGEKIAMRTFRDPVQDFTTSTWPLTDDGGDATNPNPDSWTVGDVTRWVYDPGTGKLAEKQFPKLQPTDPAKTTRFTYNAAGTLATQEWFRVVPSGPNAGQRVKATYTYDPATGDHTGITYNDGTPAVTYTYTRLAQPDSIADATGTRDLVYDPSYPLRLYSEALDTFYGQRVVTRLYETSGEIGRPRGFKLGATVGSNSELEQTYAYSATTGRFDTLTTSRNSNASTRTFHYGFEPDSNLIKTLWTGDNSFFVTRSFEANRDVLTSVAFKWGQSASADFTRYTYQSDDLGRRQSVEQSGTVFGGAYATSAIHQTFAYNDRSEVTAAPTKLGTVASPGGALANRQHEFDYDAIGNRKWAGITGNTADRKSYTANALNQYSSRQNSTTPFSGTQSFTYDADGNVLSDGHWLYEWDAENRLVALQTDPTAIGIIALVDARRLEFKYDHLHRRVEKLVRAGFNGTVYTTVVAQNRYLYDGWNLAAEYAVSGPSSLVLGRSYTWGLDIARTLVDAGGVGALLQIVNHATGAAYHPTYDGNGNIAALIETGSGTVAVAYEYSPFGETIRRDVTDTTIGDQPFRFSTKFTDDESGLVYYGRRYYSPSQGRFLGRDPKMEKGGLNLYGFVSNNPGNKWDYLGMLMQGQDWDFLDELFTVNRRIAEIKEILHTRSLYYDERVCLEEELELLEWQKSNLEGQMWGTNDWLANRSYNQTRGMPEDASGRTTGSGIDLTMSWSSRLIIPIFEPVHQWAIDKALPNVDAGLRGALKRAVEFADGPEFQTPEMSFRHAMRDGRVHEDGRPYETVEEARAKANAFVREKILNAQRLFKGGPGAPADYKGAAMRELGLAMHTLQDATSPSHVGFQPWKGPDSQSPTSHMFSENYYPNDDSALIRATHIAWQYFEGSIPLPDDFFAPTP